MHTKFSIPALLLTTLFVLPVHGANDLFNSKFQQLKNNVPLAQQLEAQAAELMQQVSTLKGKALDARTAALTPDEFLQFLNTSNLKFSENTCQFESSYEAGGTGYKILDLKVTKTTPDGSNSESKTWGTARLYVYDRADIIKPFVMALEASADSMGAATISSDQSSYGYGDKLESDSVRAKLDAQGNVVNFRLSDSSGTVIECGPTGPVYY